MPLLLAAFCLAPMAQAQASLTATAPASTARLSPTAPPAFGGPTVVLYNQVQGSATSGIVSQNNATATQFNNIAGDDFSVPGGQTWSVTQVFARGFYTTAGTPGTCTSGDVSFWTNGADNKPGTVIQTRSGAPSSDVTGALTFDFAAVSLTTGTYWVTIVCNGPNLDLGVSGRWNWFYNTVQNMQPAVLRNDNGGFGVPAGWNYINTLGAGIGPDFDYSISGTSSGVALLPELEVTPTSLMATVPSGGMTTATLMIMNTGTADLTFAFPAFVTLQRIESLRVLGIDLSRPMYRGATIEMPKGVESIGTPGGTGAEYRVGGPDAFGYTFIDSSEPNGPTLEAIDIAATGTVQTLANYTGCTAGDAEDEGRVAVTLPFTFPFYGQDVTTFQVYANGVMGVNPDFAACTFGNSSTIPNTAGINGFIAPYWDDLDLGDTGRILTQTLDDGRFVVQWDMAPRFGGAETGAPNTFQAILSPNGGIKFQYLDINAVTNSSNTVGIENQTGTDGLLVNANTAGYVVDGLAVQINAPTRFITGVTPPAGTVAPGGSTTVTVALSGSADGTPLPEGTYMQDLILTSNDPDEATVTIPVTLTVTAPAPPGDVEVTPNPVVETLESGETGTETVTLTNNTDAAVDFSFPQYAAAARVRAQQPTVAQRAKGDDTFSNASAFLDEGGPDAFGYQWIDSNEPGGPTFDFMDISTTGTEVTLASYSGCTAGDAEDEGRAAVTLPNAFSFYGEQYATAYVYSNGIIGFDASFDACAFTNQAIPTATGINNFIAPYWDDLDLGETGQIHTQSMSDGSFVIQYTNVPRFASSGPGATFQVILLPGGAIKYQYQAVPATNNSNTIGIENADGTDGLQIAFNTTVRPNYPQPGLAVLIQARPTFLTAITPPSGTIPANSSVTVDFTFDASGLLGGQYTGEVTLETSVDTLSVPVVLNVTGNPTVTITPDPVVFGDVIAGASTTQEVTITNNGTSDLVISSITTDNAAYTVDTAGPLTLAPGASATVTVTFMPTAVGAANATLTVTSNASSSPDTVMLMGNGLAAPTFTASPAALTFVVFEGQVSDPQTVTLTNSGAGAGTFDVTTALVTPLAQGTPQRAAATELEAAKALSGRMPSTPGVEYRGGDIVQDGSFEAGTPNPFWTEASVEFGSPICSIALCGLGGGTGPRTGDFWTWFGGAPNGDTGSMEQSVTIPGGSASLNFWLEIPLITVGGTGYVAVLMDGTEVFRATYADDQAQYATYSLVNVDVSAYADGGAHTLRFESVTTGSGNFFVDDVSIDVEAGVLLTATPATGTVAAGGSQAITVTADATNAEPGPYQAELRIATDDPANPEIVIPVTINVLPFVANEDADLPSVVTLYPNFPNPAAQATTIRYALPQSATVGIHVFDVTGRRVATLADGEEASGFHDVVWDTRSLASGMYVVRMQAGQEVRTLRVSVVR